MNVQEIISLSISTIALIISIVSIAYQYQIRVNLKYRINEVSFFSLEPQAGEMKTAALGVSISLYNLGNRPVAIESISMSIDEGDFAVLSKNPPRTCNLIGTLLVPISRASYSQLSVEPFVVSKEDIATRELIFDMFHFNKSKSLALSGLACLHIKGSDANGNLSAVSVPVALVAVSIDRPKDKIQVDFNTKPYQAVANLPRLLGE
jgi:hypothetical protein